MREGAAADLFAVHALDAGADLRGLEGLICHGGGQPLGFRHFVFPPAVTVVPDRVEAERELIYRTLQQTRWNRREAAEILGISYKALLYKIKEAELDRAS